MACLIALKELLEKTWDQVKSSKEYRDALQSIMVDGIVRAGRQVEEFIGRDLYSIPVADLELVFKDYIPSFKWYAQKLLTDRSMKKTNYQVKLQDLLVLDAPLCNRNLQNVESELRRLYSREELYNQCWQQFVLISEQNSYQNIAIFCCYVDYGHSFRRVKSEWFYKPMKTWSNNTQHSDCIKQVIAHLIALRSCIEKTLAQKVQWERSVKGEITSSVSIDESKELREVVRNNWADMYIEMLCNLWSAGWSYV